MEDTELKKNICDLEYQTYKSRHRLSIGLFFTVLFGVLSLVSWRSMLETKSKIEELS